MSQTNQNEAYVKSSTYIDFKVENNSRGSKFNVDDEVQN